MAFNLVRQYGAADGVLDGKARLALIFTRVQRLEA